MRTVSSRIRFTLTVAPSRYPARLDVSCVPLTVTYVQNLDVTVLYVP